MKDGLVILVVRNEDGQRLARNSKESFRKFDFNCYFFRKVCFRPLLSRCESGVIKDTPLVLISQVSVYLSSCPSLGVFAHPRHVATTIHEIRDDL